MPAFLASVSTPRRRLGRRRLWLGVGALALACGPVQRVSDCNRLAAIVNPTFAAIEATVRAEGDERARYARVSRQYLALERRLGAEAPPADPGVAELLVQYRQQLARAGQLTEQLSGRGDEAETTQRSQLELDLERLAERQRALSRQLELACLGHR